MSRAPARKDEPDRHLAAEPFDLAGFLAQLPAMPALATDRPPLFAAVIDTPLGAMVALEGEEGLCLLEFADRRALPASMDRFARRNPLQLARTSLTDRLERALGTYFAGGGAADFAAIPLAPEGTVFQRSVWQVLHRIPAGETRSYRDLARMSGRPEAVRAVAAANGRNEIAILIPCHRIIGADGKLTGYGGGIARKRRLLALEAGFDGRKTGESS